MKLAAEIELPFSEFWEMTPYELNLKARVYSNKQKQEYENRITLEYYNAMWTIQWLGKKSQHPEPLKKILENMYKEKKKTMTDDEMLAKAMVLNSIFGGTVKEK